MSSITQFTIIFYLQCSPGKNTQSLRIDLLVLVLFCFRFSLPPLLVNLSSSATTAAFISSISFTLISYCITYQSSCIMSRSSVAIRELNFARSLPTYYILLHALHFQCVNVTYSQIHGFFLQNHKGASRCMLPVFSPETTN